jgi:PAS domain S-box-containing protein
MKLWQLGAMVILLPFGVQLGCFLWLAELSKIAAEQAAREDHSRRIVESAQSLLKLSVDAGLCIGIYYVSKNPMMKERYEDAAAEIPETLKTLNELVQDNPKERKVMVQLTTDANEAYTLMDKLKSQVDEGPRLGGLISGHEIYRKVKKIIENLEAEIDSFVSEERATRSPDFDRNKQSEDQVRGIIFAAWISFAAVGIASWFFWTFIALRLRMVHENTIALTKSSILHPPLKGNDEIAEVDRAFHSMANALTEAYHKERAMLENALDVICSIDAEGRFRKVSPASLEVLGYLPEELMGRKYTDLLVLEDVEPTVEAVEKIMSQDEEPQPIENRAIRKDGTVVHILWSAFWAPAEQAMFCVVHDITERKIAENQLRASEARVRMIFENAPVALLVIDTRGVIKLSNPAAEQMFGYRAQELSDRHVSFLMPKSPEFDEIEFSEDMYTNMVGHVKEVEAQSRTGNVFPIELTLANFTTGEGERFLAAMLDVSERHEMERLKREFVSTVSHELRTPLTAIRGSLTLLSVGAMGGLTEQAKKVVTIAERNSIRLINLINDLLDIEKLEAGKLEMVFDAAPLQNAIERSVESVKAFGDQYGIKVESATTDAAVFADSDRLVQVIINLLSNAIKYSPRDGLVSVEVSKKQDSVWVGIKDRGRGIPADFKDKIFERFQQVEAADAKQKGGTGLGLAICKAIVEQHNGVIGVDSEEGKGSTFWFEIPLAGSPQAKRLAERKSGQIEQDEAQSVKLKQPAGKPEGVANASSEAAAKAESAGRENGDKSVDVKSEMLSLSTPEKIAEERS